MPQITYRVCDKCKNNVMNTKEQYDESTHVWTIEYTCACGYKTIQKIRFASEGAYRARKEMLERRNALAEELRKTALSIAILGPSEENHLYEKRVKIRNILEEKGHSAMFCEDIMKFFPVAEFLDPFIDELFQLESEDLVICLDVSPGPGFEVAHYSKIKDVAQKMIIFFPKEKSLGFERKGWLTITPSQVVSFTSEDIERCNLIKKVLEICEWKRKQKYLEKRGIII